MCIKQPLQQSPRVTHTAAKYVMLDISSVRFFNKSTVATLAPHLPVVQRLRGHPGQELGWTEAVTGIYPIAPLSGGGATLFIS